MKPDTIDGIDYCSICGAVIRHQHCGGCGEEVE